MSEADTKTLILDAAEEAFADLGFDAASLRHIIAMAGVNLAAVHYHFGGKEALIEAVFERRILPLNEERLRLLDRLEEESGEAGPTVERLLEALVGPPLRLSLEEAKGGRNFARVLGRVFTEPDPFIQRMLHARFEGLLKRFMAAFARALPSLPEAELVWRLHFAGGAVGHTMIFPKPGCPGPVLEDGGRVEVENVLGRLVVFLAAGLRAAAPGKEKGR